MIGRLKGTLLDKQPPMLLIDVNGVGYEVEAPMTVFYDLPANGEPLTLVTHLQVKDDGHSLFGFAGTGQRELFRTLLKISGIGAKLALTILSGATTEELTRMVAHEDTAALTQMPGIGKKTAERLIVELRDKLDGLDQFEPMTGGGKSAGPRDAQSEAIAGLQALGYKPAEAARRVKSIYDESLEAPELIRKALREGG